FSLDDKIVLGGTVIDLVAVVHEPADSPVIITANYDYNTPNNITNPANGEIQHSNKETDALRISTTDNDGTDRYALLDALDIGDVIEAGGTRWAIQSTVDNTTWFAVTVTPEVQISPDGVKAFNFETVVATPIDCLVDTDYWTTSSFPATQGLLGVDTAYVDIILDSSAYGMGMQVQNAYVSADWGVVALSGGTSGGSGGDGADSKVMVSASDIVTSYLSTKLVPGSGVELNILNSGDDETLEVVNTGISKWYDDVTGIRHNGNVGIDIDPQYKLHTKGSIGIADSGGLLKIFFDPEGDSYFNNGNVGIGTVSPNYTLDVRGQFGITLGGQYYKHRIAAIDSSATITADQVGTDSSAYIRCIYTDGSGVSTIGLYSDTGRAYFMENVGIGTSSPNTELEVSTYQNPKMRLNNTDAAITVGNLLGTLEWYSQDLSVGIEGVAAEIRAYATADFTAGRPTSIGIFTAGATGDTMERMTVTYEGNVGIGTDSPTATIQTNNVGGKWAYLAQMNDASLFGVYSHGTYGAQTYWYDQVAALKVVIAANGNSYFNGGNVGIGTNSPLYNLVVRDATGSSVIEVQAPNNTSDALIRFAQEGVPVAYIGYDASVGVLKLSGTSSFSTISHLVIDNSGNVGIGTASPDKLLELSASTDATLRLTSTVGGTASAINIGLIEFYGSSTHAPGAGVKAQILVDSDSYGDDANIKFYTSDGTNANNQLRMTIRNNGNVGIGTTSPAITFEVDGKIGAGKYTSNGLGYTFQISDITNTIGNDVLFGIHTSSNDVVLSATNPSGSSIANIVFRTENSSGTTGERMRIEGDGNVGIGTTSPTYKLDVAGTGRFTGDVYFEERIITSGDSIDTNNDIAYHILDATIKPGVNSIRLSGTSINLEIDSANASPYIGRSLYLTANNTGMYPPANLFGLYVDKPTGGVKNQAAYFGGNVGIGIIVPGTVDSIQAPDSGGNYLSLHSTEAPYLTI
ncbi:MAG: hypothetical protein DRQ43_09105, partial [Gammaproteobacteria bacterium]